MTVRKNINSTDRKLKERIKELNCLYELSRMAWREENNLQAVVEKTLEILPKAMQYHSLAEASITVHAETFSTKQFAKSGSIITAALMLGKKRFGHVRVGYRPASRRPGEQPRFLAEERNLIRAVARELSFFVQRAMLDEEKGRLQIQLQHAERLAFVGELSAGIAHELNEPLGGILGFAQLIKKTGTLNDQQAEDTERIIKAALYTREIIKKLMIFSRQMPRQISSVNLNRVAENILYFIDARFQGRKTRIAKVLDENLPDILADEVQISQVIVNLISNAVQAMPEGGQITLATKKKGKQVSLVVKDTGVGMTSNIKSRIFEPFFTTKPVGQGTGLGLSVVQGIIDAHGGKILVSSAPQKGSKFEILLPLK